MSQYIAVAPREGRVSRNISVKSHLVKLEVAPREGRVSRNLCEVSERLHERCRAPRGACE